MYNQSITNVMAMYYQEITGCNSRFGPKVR